MEGEAREPEHSSPGPPPQAPESGLLTWTCISKSEKRIENQACTVSAKILKKAKAVLRLFAG